MLLLPYLALRTVRFSTFPEYLMVQLAKFSFGEDWVPKKYGMLVLYICTPVYIIIYMDYYYLHGRTYADVLVDVPDQLDLTHLRGCGLQQGEAELPEDQQQQPAPQGSDYSGVPG